MEIELEKIKIFFVFIVENIFDMIFVKDVKILRFLELNKVGESLIGYMKEEVLGKNDYELFF